MTDLTGKRHAFARTLLYAVLVLGTVIMLLPMVWMALTSLKSGTEVQLDPPTLLPQEPRWENYAVTFSEFNFTRYLANSLLVAVLSTVGTLVSATMAAYAFVAYRVPGRGFFFGLLISVLLLPAQVTVIPQFQLFAQLGWVNTLLPLIVPAWFGTNVFAVFLLRQFFLTLPVAFIEAARLDGASEWRILWTIFVPLSKPALLTVALFNFLGSWNDLWGPLVFVHDEARYTLPLGLLKFMAEAGKDGTSQVNLIMAVATVMTLPIVTLFFLAQKRFIEGVASAGVKG